MENAETQIPTGPTGNNAGENGGGNNDGLPPGIERAKSGGGSGMGKRGRPPGSKNRNTPLDTGATVAPKSAAAANINALESAAFIGKGFVALVELGETFVHNAAATKIEKKFPSKLAEFKEMAQSVSLTPKDAELMRECATAIALKHDILTRFGPEVVLAVTLAQYSMRQITLLRFVEKVTEEKKAEPAN
jgi:hypothetical protein